MDLEMTGLDPDRHVVVEIATLVTDDDLAIVAEGPDLVIHASERELDEMTRSCARCTSAPGSSPPCRPPRSPSPRRAPRTLDFLRQHLPEPGTVPLAGNSIGTDRRFLAAQLPEVSDWFHYRSVDVSSIKELARRWYPDAVAAAPDKRGAHRAMDDIKESIEELAYYRSTIFRRKAAQGAP